MTERRQDKRPRRTRAWIVQAFNELIFKRAYAGLRTDYIIKRAGVGRSTFYEHFRNKDEVLLQSVSWILTTLADAGNVYRIGAIVDHILDQKAMAKPLLSGPGGAAMTAELARLIEARLARDNVKLGTELLVPMPLAARQVAEAQMALLRGWLENAPPCPSSDLATALCRSSRGLIEALQREENAYQ